MGIKIICSCHVCACGKTTVLLQLDVCICGKSSILHTGFDKKKKRKKPERAERALILTEYTYKGEFSPRCRYNQLTNLRGISLTSREIMVF